MYNKRLKDRHVKVKSCVGDIDPLEVDHLPSEDEWLVGDEEGESSDPLQRHRVSEMTNEDLENLFDEELITNDGSQDTSSSRSRGCGGHQGSNKAKKSTNAQGKAKGTRSGFHLIDEEDKKQWEDVDEDEEREDGDDMQRTDMDSDNDD